MSSSCRQLHSPTNLLLLSLAVSDFIMGFLVMPVEILMMWTCWVLGDLLCALYYFLPVTLLNSSVGNMVLISVDRYVAISFLLLHNNLEPPGRYNSCHGECIMNIIAADMDLVVSFIIPIIVILGLYMRVFVVAVSQARAMRSHVAAVKLQPSGTVMTMKSELKAAGTLGVVIIVFLLCYCPFYGLCLTGSNILIGSVLESYMSFLKFCNSGLDPLIYALFYPWFRKAVKHIFTLQILQPGSRDTNML
uniref:trace amine-associated receptor 13c-like n=1 Tax=Monopterus albus TaxID=43700 RepID=UPI0009B4971A|nr:trace amine-associated receptor 13c-like [Monopterus albus]